MSVSHPCNVVSLLPDIEPKQAKKELTPGRGRALEAAKDRGRRKRCDENSISENARARERETARAVNERARTNKTESGVFTGFRANSTSTDIVGNNP